LIKEADNCRVLHRRQNIPIEQYRLETGYAAALLKKMWGVPSGQEFLP